MKKMLIGLLAFGNIPAFANISTELVKVCGEVIMYPTSYDIVSCVRTGATPELVKACGEAIMFPTSYDIVSCVNESK